MNTLLLQTALQASSTQVSTPETRLGNILAARSFGSVDETIVSFQLTNTDTKTAGQETSGSVEEQVFAAEALLVTKMVPASMSDMPGTVTHDDPQLLSQGTISPVTPTVDTAPSVVSSLSEPEQQIAKDVLLTLRENPLDKPVSIPATGALYASSAASLSHADSAVQSTAILKSASGIKNSIQLATPSADQISQLSVSQNLKETLPISMTTPNQTQPGTTTSQNGLHFGAPAQVHTTEWASIKVDTNAAKWGEQMMQVLHDRVTLQAQQSVQEAKIRLDPPELGKLNLNVRVEGDTLNVQINANAASTRDALVQVSDRLRAELQNQNFLNVNVSVGSDDANQQQTTHQEPEEFTIFSARDTDQPDSLSNLSEHWLSTQA